MTDELDAVQARADAATEGPWQVSVANGYIITEGDGSGFVLARTSGPGVGGRRDFPNADFIAAARSDVPDLLGEVRRLRDALAALEDENARMSEVISAFDGSEVESFLTEKVMAVETAFVEGMADQTLRNLIAALTRALAIALANGRWAAAENRRAERATQRAELAEAENAAIVEAARETTGLLEASNALLRGQTVLLRTQTAELRDALRAT